VTPAALRTEIVILACAISAGIHGALVRDHFAEGLGPGLGFVAATALPAALAVVLRERPTRHGFLAATVVFAGLIAAYAAVVATGVPMLHPSREGVDGLALVTKAVEAVGLVAAASLVPGRLPAIPFAQPKGTLT
jgi:hypothetical protein